MGFLTLATSTIGDLLLNGRLSNTGRATTEREVNLVIPEYQRPYKWTARNAMQLLDDIIEAMNANKEVYRVGTLILHREVKDGAVRHNIVDGQQRTITFALMLSALYEKEDESKRPDIKFLDSRVFANPYNLSNIPKNMLALRRRIAGIYNGEDDGQEHIRFMRKLRDYVEHQCELIVVITDSQTEAFQFFDSQNARGKSLYPHDLLKAYHLREMTDESPESTEKIVARWENIHQNELNDLFGEYLYRVKEWINGNRADVLSEHNIYKFKGISRNDNSPYAQFYKSAYSYANFINTSAMPFVSGTREVNAFQINTPVIAGKPFFDYTHHYFALLKDIRDNSKYEGFYVQDNAIVKTLDRYYNRGIGNGIARLLFNTALLLYVDRFCPPTYPTKVDIEMFEQFLVYAFVWAYSLRTQYSHLGWASAQNFVLGIPSQTKNVKNAINIFKITIECDSPVSLLSVLADKLVPISGYNTPGIDDYETVNNETIYRNYLHYFKTNSFLS